MITVFGSINLDLIGRVERLPGPGETVAGSEFLTAPGGKGANQALAAARAGGKVRLVGAVGSDSFAESALALLRAGEVDLSLIQRVEGAAGVAFVLVDARGENSIVVVPGANGRLRDSTAVDFRAEDCLLLQLEVPVPVSETVAQRARAAGAEVLLNFAPFREEALGLIEPATHLIMNESESALLASSLGLPLFAPAEQAGALAQRCACAVIVTLGERGALLATPDRVEMIPALPIRPLDTVGAGDTFCGYLAAGLAEGLALSDALRLAAAAGSLACTRPGAQSAIPFRSEVEKVLA